ncbi:MAG: YitT family protein [Clostridia bacterium]|nr:YitT family protein [Clostridia bacterium]
MSKAIKRMVFDLLWYTMGGFIYSSAVTMFISPNKFSPGGFTGIATVLNHLLNLPSGFFLLLLNVPVLVLGFIKFGGYFIAKTTVATVILSFSLTVTDLVLPAFEIDRILAAVFGGILMGLGLSIIMLRGATTGGVDIIAKLINKKSRHLTMGRIILIFDAFVILLATVIYRNIESALYSVISIYATSIIMDMMLYGGDKGKIIYIVSDFSKEICNDINNLLGRGVTMLSATGGYTGKEKTMLFCTVRRHQVSAVYEISDKYDKNAFIVISDAGEIIGEGFKALR